DVLAGSWSQCAVLGARTACPREPWDKQPRFGIRTFWRPFVFLCRKLCRKLCRVFSKPKIQPTSSSTKVSEKASDNASNRARAHHPHGHDGATRGRAARAPLYS